MKKSLLTITCLWLSLSSLPMAMEKGLKNFSRNYKQIGTKCFFDLNKIDDHTSQAIQTKSRKFALLNTHRKQIRSYYTYEAPFVSLAQLDFHYKTLEKHFGYANTSVIMAHTIDAEYKKNEIEVAIDRSQASCTNGDIKGLNELALISLGVFKTGKIFDDKNSPSQYDIKELAKQKLTECLVSPSVLSLLESGVRKKDDVALFWLGIAYCQGIAKPTKNTIAQSFHFFKGLRLITQAQKMGNLFALEFLGTSHALSRERLRFFLRLKPLNNISFLQRASDKGFGLATYNLAVLHEFEWIKAEKKTQKALKFYQLAEKQGLYLSRRQLEDRLEICSLKVREEKALQENDSQALYELAKLHKIRNMNVSLRERDALEMKSITLFRQASERGHVESTIQYSEILTGIGDWVISLHLLYDPENFKRGVKLMTALIGKGNAKAVTQLAHIYSPFYRRSSCQDTNLLKAISLYNKAASEFSDPAAMKSLENIYSELKKL